MECVCVCVFESWSLQGPTALQQLDRACNRCLHYSLVKTTVNQNSGETTNSIYPQISALKKQQKRVEGKNKKKKSKKVKYKTKIKHLLRSSWVT